MNVVKLIAKAFARLRAAAMNPFRRVVRKIQMLFNVNLITAKLITPISKKIRSVLTIKAKSPEDYLTIGSFWISKKLIHFLILAACAFTFIYFQWFAAPVTDTVAVSGVVTTTYYDYDDLDLAEYSGKANIRAANHEVVYTGSIAEGVCSGNGTLWNQDGTLVYEGMFANNDFNGTGTLYYPNGKVKYTGSFVDNVFSGEGVGYYSDGIIQYEGEFENGAYSGTGVLYNEKGNMIYEGEFQSGNFHGSGVSYFDTGIKKYEGEFYMGKAQGHGTLYSKTGKRLYTGQFARDDIYYESLFGYNLEELSAKSDESTPSIFGENPYIYYSDTETCFLYPEARVILKMNCSIAAKLDENATTSGDGWFLPEDAGEEELPTVAEDSETVEFKNGDGEEDTETVSLPVKNTGSKYSLYYYLDSKEWQRAAELDKTKINVIGVAAIGDDYNMDLLKDMESIPMNGAANLLECIAIDQVRGEIPTAFSNISFEQKSQNKTYNFISGINLAQSIYVEYYELENIRYKLCYENDDPTTLKFVVLETY